MSFLAGNYDVIVVGAGHAGCEAALASARMGMKTILITLSLDSIALMPCNPAIGGTGKSQLVKEVDALGGQMGINIDKTLIQSRILNATKGPAVQSVRAQADRIAYQKRMKTILENQENLEVTMDEVVSVLKEGDTVCGVETKFKARYMAKAVILTKGVFLKSKIYMGETNFTSGPLGLPSAEELSDSLKAIGVKLRRFKTGTPARIHGDSINFEVMEPQEGDLEITPFSSLHESNDFDMDQVKCYLTRTTPKTLEIIRSNINRSAMYRGDIQSTGPRYCPSIEDKVVRFSDKPSHQFFIEPEGLDTKEYYIQGFSTSMPLEVQMELYHSVTGLENAQIMRPAYAIEYDCIDPLDLKPSLEIKGIGSLFSAGQFNGTSGYEEAAAQGLMAGINAALKIQGKEPFILDRSEAYIGVLIDDLVTKGTNEPYRMMTSRSEYRLLLRQDNADLRLTEKGREIGVVDDFRYESFLAKKEMIEKELKRLKLEKITQKESEQYFIEREATPLSRTLTLYEFLKRPEADYKGLIELGKGRTDLPKSVIEQCEITAKYEGYINKQLIQVEQFKKLEQKKLPENIEYDLISGLRLEARQKLNEVRPISLGQASRISGVSPADISVLLIYLSTLKRGNRNEQ